MSIWAEQGCYAGERGGELGPRRTWEFQKEAEGVWYKRGGIRGYCSDKKKKKTKSIELKGKRILGGGRYPPPTHPRPYHGQRGKKKNSPDLPSKKPGGHPKKAENWEHVAPFLQEKSVSQRMGWSTL